MASSRQLLSIRIGYAKHRSRSDLAVIRVYDATGNVIETHGYTRNFKEPAKSVTT